MSDTHWTIRPEGATWGDYGPDDQIGRMNLLTPDVRLRASREIRAGRSFCLSLPLDYPGGNALLAHRSEPRFHYAARGDGFNFNYALARMSPCACDVMSDEAVTLEDVKRVAGRLMVPGGLRFVVVGKPVGLQTTN